MPTWRCPARCKAGPRDEMVAAKFSASDDCAIIRRFHLSAAGFANVPFRFASTIDSLLSASVGSPESGDAGSGAVGI